MPSLLTLHSDTVDFIHSHGIHNASLYRYEDEPLAEVGALQCHLLDAIAFDHMSPDGIKADEYALSIPMTSYSDYSGSLVQASNYGYITENFGDIPGLVEVQSAYCGHSLIISIATLDRYFSRDADTESTDLIKDLIGIMDALTQYPLACEEHHSQLEETAKSEAWLCWAEADLIRGLEHEYEIEITPDTEDQQPLQELFNRTIEKLNLHWSNPQGTDMWIDLDRIVASIELSDLDGITYTVD